MENNTIKLRIYGVRGSYPPSNSNITEIGVNTTSLRLDVGKHVIIFDAGTGIINLGADLISEWKAGNSNQNLFNLHLFFTHTHIDHLMGFPYFSMLYLPQTQLNVISPIFHNQKIETILNTLMNPVFFPVTIPELGCNIDYFDFAEKKAVYFLENEFQILSNSNNALPEKYLAKISSIRNYTHPKGGTYIYKIEKPDGQSIVFATDIEGFVGGDQRLTNFSKNARVLIHDAQYTLNEYAMFQGYGHSTYEMACDVAKKAEVEKLILFHHDPKHTDKQLTEIENKAKSIFPGSAVATEKMVFTI